LGTATVRVKITTEVSLKDLQISQRSQLAMISLNS
jgi:hypothetical protein